LNHNFKILILVSSSLFYSNAFAVGTHFSIPKQKRAYYSYKKACQRVGYSETLLVEPIGVRALNCMGERVDISTVCMKDKKFKLEPFVRGYIDLVNKRVVCQFGKQALLTLSCEKDKTRKYCGHPQKSCQKLQRKFAHQLVLSHQSRLFKGDEELLHCYYIHSKNENNANQGQKSLLDIPEELTF
jgi:hypothetical protein